MGADDRDENRAGLQETRSKSGVLYDDDDKKKKRRTSCANQPFIFATTLKECILPQFFSNKDTPGRRNATLESRRSGNREEKQAGFVQSKG